jgi:sigma-B regulation protein RsbU (phosphoserine phosphatase)
MARQTRIGRLSIRLAIPTALAIVLLNLHILRILDILVIVFCGVILLPLVPILAYRWITRRVLWKVRNRLILTYLLMGLAPVVLFAMLGGIAAYLFCGQFSTNTALSILDQESLKVKDETASEAAFNLSSQAAFHQTQKSHPTYGSTTLLHHSSAFAGSRVSIAILDGPIWRPLLASSASGSEPMPISGGPLPPWLHAPFRGVVVLKRKLYICSVLSVPTGSTSVLVLGAMPLDPRELVRMSKGLGSISIFSGFSHLTDNQDEPEKPEQPDQPGESTTFTNPAAPAPKRPSTSPRMADAFKSKEAASKDSASKDDASKSTDDSSDEGIDSVSGPDLPARAHFYDTPVFFQSSIPVRFWASGRTADDMIIVKSRPTFLFARLFANAVTVGTFVRAALYFIAIFFAIIECVALLFAFGLSRTITRSVNDIYRGTKAIDAGHLEHRIRVARHDQLGDLARSFNGMAASVSDLLVQQREKERLLNELQIAQEVQSTLFPISPAFLGGLEMHALNIPASTVGGDYYDFIFGSHSGLCLALGDISGKGISAALLMASLHSAVRAFSLGEEDPELGHDHTQPSPAFLLKLLNRHLYLSTQSARYATLFLAFYDVKTHKLTYSNGGHLPPLLLSADGTVRRLDCGGSVVGLLEDLEYEEGTVQLESGDLLIAFTDGLTEPENPALNSLEFGEPRLLELMQLHRTEPLPTLALNTLRAIKAWIGDNEQPDDMTILLARQL